MLVTLTNRQVAKIHRVSKNVPPLACYTTLTYANGFWYFFGRNATNKVSSQNTPYCATSNNLWFCITRQKRETRKLHFSLAVFRGSALPGFNQSLFDFFSLFDSRLILTLLYDSLNLVINAFSSGLLGTWFKRKEVESAAAVGLCCMHKAPLHQCPVFWPRFPLSQGNAKTLGRWGGKTKHHLISYFISHTSAENIAVWSCTSRL